MGKITLLTGGVRSGKSTFALDLAKKNSGRKAFVATALAIDNEMNDRIEKHKVQREGSFCTIEEPYDLAAAMARIEKDTEVAVIDCLTVWLGNLFYKFDSDENRIVKTIDEFIGSIKNVPCDLIIVTNETGWGIVPESEMGRKFRDISGYVNQAVAKAADTVYLVCCGIPVVIKSEKPGLS
jgi:adenosylcobinamide kinase/adenosylcobinamide-phosphate guanylyltransferase